MSVYTYDSDAATCPVCHHRVSLPQPMHLVSGLLTCPQCRVRLVRSRSGNFVRDPFTGQRAPTGQALRRQSRPFARLLRDAGITRSPSVVTIVGGLMLLGLTLVAWGGMTGQFLPELNNKVEHSQKL
jgi:hypothetical protein